MAGGARRPPSRPWWPSARRALIRGRLWPTALALAALATPGAADIAAADFAEPTTRYPHGLLGDAVEYGALRLTLADGRTLLIRLPETRVFEDLAARLADLDGDGLTEIACIDRPHLARTLRIWRYTDGTLTEIATARGLTNHRIGDAFISGGLRDCVQGPEILLARPDWSGIVAARACGPSFSGPTYPRG